MPHHNEPVVIDVEYSAPSQTSNKAFVVKTERFRARRLSFIAGLFRLGQRFCVANPTLMSIIGRIADGLSQLGI